MNAISPFNVEEMMKTATKMTMPWMETNGFTDIQNANLKMMTEATEEVMAATNELIEKQADRVQSAFEMMADEFDSVQKVTSPQEFAQVQIAATQKVFQFGMTALQDLTKEATRTQAAVMESLVGRMGQMSEEASTSFADMGKKVSGKKA